MDSALKAYGLTADDGPYAAAFEHWARGQGWTTKQIEDAFRWYGGAVARCKSKDEFVESFARHAVATNLSPEHRTAATDWFEASTEADDWNLPPDPTAAEDAQRAAEIRETLKSDPAAYWRDPSMRREYASILERQELYGDGDTPPTDTSAKRMDEIREIMKTDIHRYRNEGLDKEYQSILEARNPTNTETTTNDQDNDGAGAD